MEGSESILPCTRDLGGQNNNECVPLSMTGTELLARLRQWLVDASNCTDGMNATTKVFFHEIEELCKERQLNIRIFHNKNVENKDGEIHHMVQNWMREHLPTLKKNINGRTTNTDHPILKRFFEVFNTVFFGGALPARLCSGDSTQKAVSSGRRIKRVGNSWDRHLIIDFRDWVLVRTEPWPALISTSCLGKTMKPFAPPLNVF